VITELVIDKRVLERLKRHLLRYYPQEHIEGLWGKIRGDSARVYVIGEPNNINRHPDGCEWDAEPEEHAEDIKLTYLGTVHSHPMTCAHPSDTDWKLLTESDEESCEELILGVCGIRKQGGRRFVSWKFFGKDGEPLELVIAE
jgi:proteasome lid subunit RPN8/RPN11